MTPSIKPGMRVAGEPATVSNARLIAELQAVAIGIRLVGLDRLPEVMAPAPTPQQRAA